jgi:hypothetical protein
LGEDQDAGSVVDAADADVVQASVVAQGDGSGLVDAVGADPVRGWLVSDFFSVWWNLSTFPQVVG